MINSKEGKPFLLEFTRQAINKEINFENYLNLVEQFFKEFPQFINSSLIEVIWLLGFIIEKLNETHQEDPEINQTYSKLVNMLIKKKILLTPNLIEKLEDSSLFTCGLINDKKSFKTKIMKINTKITYEPQKYNLLREESEGFSKLFFLFFEVKITKENLQNNIDKILSLIGFFDLDPNRVLDIILTNFEKDYLNLNYLEIIKLFNRNAVPPILGFKFINKKDEEFGLYVMTAQLIKNNLVKISEIIPYLTPSLKDTENSFKSQIEAAGEYYKNLQSRVQKELNLVNVNVNQNLSDNPIQNANYFVNFNELIGEFYNKEKNNQIYKIFEGLIKIKAYEHCEIVYNLIENFYDPMVCPNLVKTMNETIEWMIEPLYKEYSLRKLFDKNNNEENFNINDSYHNLINSNEFNQINKIEDFLPEISKILKYLTLGLSTHLKLFSKILKIIKQNLTVFFCDDINIYKINETIMTDLICKVFLPSISLIDPTPSIINNMWVILQNFDYSKRYKIYNYWINNIYTTHPILYIKYGVVQKETAKWQKTLSKENQRQHGRTLGILTNNNPIIVFDNVIRLLTSYDNQINVFMQTLSFCSNLSYDVITYIISKILADPNREKFNSNTGDMAAWFKYFSFFIGHFFKKFHFAEFGGILYYLCNRLKNTNNFIELYVLKEMVEKMSGIVIMEELNETQINACAGGLQLYLESMDLVKDYKNFKKSNQALLNFFINNANRNEKNENDKDKEISNILITGNETTLMIIDKEDDINEVNINVDIEVHSKNIEMQQFSKKENESENENSSIENGSNVSIIFSGKENYNKTLEFTSVLLILLGSRKQNIIFNSNLTQSKLIGYLYDLSHNVYLQLVQFLQIHTDQEIFNKFLPNWRLERFVINYNLQPDVIFYLNRNKLQPIYEMSDEEYSDTLNQYMGVLDTYKSLNKKVFLDNFDSIYLESHQFLDDLYKDIWSFITPELYFIFHALQLKDIYVPLINYERELEKNKKEVERLTEESKNYYESKNKKEIEKIKNNIQNLEKELNVSKRNNERVLKFLESKKSTILDENLFVKSNKREISSYFIQYCLYPRLIFSKVDAVYTAKILNILINLKIQNLNVFDTLQKMVKYLMPCILCLTEFEAQNLGVFLLELLKIIKYWQDEFVWENECIKNPSFSRNLDTATPVEFLEFKKVIILLLNKMNSTFVTIFNGIYPPTQEIADELTINIEKALIKFINYEDLQMMLKRYRDILVSKRNNLPAESEVIGEVKEKATEIKDKERYGQDKKKKQDKTRDKKRDESSKTPDIKKRSPEEYRTFKQRK